MSWISGKDPFRVSGNEAVDWQGTFKVGDGLPLPLEQLYLDLVDKDVATPSMPNRLGDVLSPFGRAFDFIENDIVVEPGHLCSNSLHKCRINICFGIR